MSKSAKQTKALVAPRRFQKRARQRQDKDKLRQLILDVVRKELAKKSVENVSLRRVEAITGYAQGNAYQYFENRRALLMAVKSESLVGIREKLTHLSGMISDPRGRVAAMFRTCVRYWSKNPDDFKSLFSMSGTSNIESC